MYEQVTQLLQCLVLFFKAYTEQAVKIYSSDYENEVSV